MRFWLLFLNHCKQGNCFECKQQKDISDSFALCARSKIFLSSLILTPKPCFYRKYFLHLFDALNENKSVCPNGRFYISNDAQKIFMLYLRLLLLSMLSINSQLTRWISLCQSAQVIHGRYIEKKQKKEDYYIADKSQFISNRRKGKIEANKVVASNGWLNKLVGLLIVDCVITSLL